VAASRVLKVADAIADLIRTFIPANTASEVKRTYFGRRFDANKTPGMKV